MAQHVSVIVGGQTGYSHVAIRFDGQQLGEIESDLMKKVTQNA